MDKLSLPKIYLASKSPRRRDILRDAGFEIEIITIDVDESYPSSLPKTEIAEFIAQKKMDAIRDLPEYGYVLTADSIVVLEDEVLEKPNDFEHAMEMLRKLSGSEHIVYTGVVLKNMHFNHSFTDKTIVKFYKLSDDEIKYYLNKFEPYDKAGSYGIQDWIGMCRIEKIDGNFFNVMGLPVQKVYEIIKNLVSPPL